MRERFRTTNGTVIYKDGSRQSLTEVREYMLDQVDGPKAHSPVLHLRYDKLASGLLPSGDKLDQFSDLPVLLRATEAIAQLVQEVPARPPKFIRNNRFDLVPFLAELDDTLAMFSLKFIKRFSYGALTWGIIPFLSDVRSLADSYSDIINGYENIFRSPHSVETVRANRKFTFDNVFNDYTGLACEASGIIRVNGTASANLTLAREKVNKLYFLLDEVGFNPDAAAVWDAIPLSFLVDYFVNIGEALEGLHPRGWANYEWNAIGYHTFKAQFRHQVRTPSGLNSGLWAAGKLFIRTGYTPIKVSTAVENKKLVFKSPSLQQWFNVLYLSTFLKKVF
uniref:Maturation protein n=1 Tax=Wenzhou levi-like virus 1 TaxID=1923567 RepID=A0A1L3KIN0_9VIRU|nr:hypothetical protein [Wenzhou levi-like virus 1]